MGKILEFNDVNITKTISGILFIIAWIMGAVSGILAWAILLLYIDIIVNFDKFK